MKRVLFLLAVLLPAAFQAQAQTPQAGEQYRVLAEPVNTSAESGQVEVREFFSYMCPHCFTFRPTFHGWEQQAAEEVKVVRTPMVFRPSWKPLAQAYYVAETLGVVDKVHQPLFEAIHVQGQQFDSAEDLAAFFADYGIDRKKFMDTWNSFAVDMKLRRGEALARQYGVMSTPSLGVAGRYYLDTRSAGGHEAMLEVASHLVEQALAGK